MCRGTDVVTQRCCGLHVGEMLSGVLGNVFGDGIRWRGPGLVRVRLTPKRGRK